MTIFTIIGIIVSIFSSLAAIAGGSYFLYLEIKKRFNKKVIEDIIEKR